MGPVIIVELWEQALYHRGETAHGGAPHTDQHPGGPSLALRLLVREIDSVEFGHVSAYI